MHTADATSYWQRFARFYGPAMRASSALYRDICRRMSPRLTPTMEVLELACGTGQLSFPLAGRVHHWIATDLTPAMIEQARKQPAPPQLSFAVQDAAALPYPDHSFDAVVIANALHVMPHPELALIEIRRVLKPGGLLFAPNFLHPVTPIQRARLRLLQLSGFHPYYSWTEVQYNAYLRAQDFTVKEECVLGRGVLPLCYVVAQTKTEE